MVVGDLVLCTFQPGSSGIGGDGHAIPMVHNIKGQIGIVLTVTRDNAGVARGGEIMFPGCAGYTHHLSDSAYEVISEAG